jgi:hypothetical protein
MILRWKKGVQEKSSTPRSNRLPPGSARITRLATMKGSWGNLGLVVVAGRWTRLSRGRRFEKHDGLLADSWHGIWSSGPRAEKSPPAAYARRITGESPV